MVALGPSHSSWGELRGWWGTSFLSPTASNRLLQTFPLGGVYRKSHEKGSKLLAILAPLKVWDGFVTARLAADLSLRLWADHSTLPVSLIVKRPFLNGVVEKLPAIRKGYFYAGETTATATMTTKTRFTEFFRVAKGVEIGANLKKNYLQCNAIKE